ncbi:hypothetical protein LshimejAT787_1105470 [Lyophyllum shimeji]|uniref:Uncharacterized protein n=1 Tax=Lyophyllum shimeji TaxID=47721 RepID=A0A9P3PTG4_LYOSH|nr:hypothetical protein LshimejAT787_1105470 [Lyophyllum shimeji]
MFHVKDLLYLWTTCRAVSRAFARAAEQVFINKHLRKTWLKIDCVGRKRTQAPATPKTTAKSSSTRASPSTGSTARTPRAPSSPKKTAPRESSTRNL